MGRKPIMANQRSIPVSFSVKPALYDRIENMAYDQRFTRSKFLQEAVLRYINFIQNKETTQNIADMPLQQKVIIGINALQDMNSDGEDLAPSVYEQMKRQIEIYEIKRIVRSVDKTETKTRPQVSPSTEADITFEKVPNQSEYQIMNYGTNVGKIVKEGSLWFYIEGEITDEKFTRRKFSRLKDAKDFTMMEWE